MTFKRIDYRRSIDPVWAFAPFGIVSQFVGTGLLRGCRHRWLLIGPASLQPSEFAKPALIIFLAYFVSLRTSGHQR